MKFLDNKFENFYKSLSKDEFEIVSRLTDITSEFNSLEEKISYSVLYYFKNSRICYIWPSSIKNGPKFGVQFGFCNGYLINDKYNILEKENRKQVYCITYNNKNQINHTILKEYLLNAIAIDNSLYSKKK